MVYVSMELGVSASVLVNEEDHFRQVKAGRWFPRCKEGEWLRQNETMNLPTLFSS
jgi:hypothetical protein